MASFGSRGAPRVKTFLSFGAALGRPRLAVASSSRARPNRSSRGRLGSVWTIGSSAGGSTSSRTVRSDKSYPWKRAGRYGGPKRLWRRHKTGLSSVKQEADDNVCIRGGQKAWRAFDEPMSVYVDIWSFC